MAFLGWCFRLLLICSCFANSVEGAPPYFDSPVWNKILPEVTTTAGTYLNTFTAKDQDVGDVITYSLESAYPWVTINSTDGRATINKTLDREAFLPSGSLTFKVQARDSTGSLAKLTVIIAVSDVNDNAPVFKNLPSTIAINEKFKYLTVFTVTVTDADATINAATSLNISAGNEEGRFSLNSGVITLVKSLDYDFGTRIYNLTITATNDRSAVHLQSSAMLTINVTDADDLPANFSQSLYEVRIDKDSPVDSVVTQVHAEDMDSFKAPVVYGIYPVSDPDGYFTINRTTGVIKVKRTLQDGVISLIATATSTSQPPAFTLVKVTVGALPNVTYTAAVVEGEPNTAVFNLQPLESYFNISGGTFSLLGNYGSQFVIAASMLKVGSQPLDRETNAQHVIEITLMKNGAAKGFAKIIVNVLDVNDNSPTFQGPHPYNLTVREDEPVGKVLLTASADDSDEGNNGTVFYEIISGNTNGVFSIDNKTGAISLIKTLDRETLDNYLVTIMIKDDGTPSLNTSTTVSITISDANDNAPVIQPAVITASVSEGAGSGTSVVTITSTDADADAYGHIVFAIESGAYGNFAINSVSGLITTNGGLSHKLRPQYTLVVTATDGGTPPRAVRGFAIINITTSSANNYRPVFSQAVYHGGIYKDTSDNFNVLTVKATDADSGTNGQVIYSIVSGNTQGLFYVESATGNVNTANTFTDKEEGDSFSFTVQATDKGSSPRVSQLNTQVTIFILTESNSVVLKSGHTQHYILQNLQEFLKDLGELSGGAHVFIKSIRPSDGNTSVIIVNGVQNLQEMTNGQLDKAFNASKGHDKYAKWKITEQAAIPRTGARLGGEEEGLSAMVVALISLSVLIGVGGIIMIIILCKKRRDEVLPRKQSRVTFNDKPLYIDPVGISRSEKPDPAQEAQEVIVHMDDETSSNDSDSGKVDPHVLNYTNEAYQRSDRYDSDNESDNFGSTEAGEIPNFGTFFPPPPTTPPPPIPKSDDEGSVDYDEVNDFDDVGTERTYIPPYEFDDHEKLDYDMFSPRHGDGQEAQQGSPTLSVTDSTAQLVEPHTYRDSLLHDPFLGFHQHSSLNDNKTTEL